MLPLTSAELEEVAAELDAVAARQTSTIASVGEGWSAFFARGNEADFLAAAASSDFDLLAARSEAVAEMTAVAGVLGSTARSLRSIEFDLSRVLSTADAATQGSPEMAAFLTEIGAIGHAIDDACALEIAFICTGQEPTSRSLSDYSDSDLQTIHEIVLAESSPEVRELAAHFPDARLLPASDGVVLTFGNIETAPSVTTVIPGVGSADPADWPGYARRTQDIAASTKGASVMWIDYRAPANLLAATATYPAATGGGRLREFQAELRRRSARRGNDPHLTVLGHSYGTVVTGHAAFAGLNADALVLAGSPGVGVKHADDLDLRGENPRVIAATSPADPISLTVGTVGGVHGPDPADPAFGAEMWPATGGHSSYWNDPEFHRRLQGLTSRS